MNRQNRRGLFAFGEIHQVQDVLAFSRRADVGNLVNLQPVEFPRVGEHQDITVSIGNEQLLDKILVARFHPHAPFAAPRLLAVGGKRGALQVAGVRHGDYHLFVGDQVFQLDFRLFLDDLGAAHVAIFLLHLLELVHDDALQDFVAGQDFLVLGDFFLQLVVLRLNFIPLESRQSLQLQFEDGLGLAVGEIETSNQPFARFLGRLRGANQFDDGIEMGERLQEPFQNVGPLFRLAQVVGRATADHRHPVVDKELDCFDERQDARLAVHDGQHDHAESLLELGVLVKIVQDHFRLFAALQLHHNAHAVTVGLILHVGDAFDFLVQHQLGDALNQSGLVHLEGNLGNHDLLLIFGGMFDGGFGAHGERAAPRLVGRLDAAFAVDERAGGKVGPGNDGKNFIESNTRFVDQQNGGLDDFGQVMRRNLGGHAHRNAVGAVDQEVGNAGGKDRWLLSGLVKIGYEIYRVLLNIGEQFFRQARQAALRVPVGSGGVAIHGAEISLAVDQHIAQVEVLGHAHQGVVDRAVTMRVILLDDLAHHAGALDIALVRRVAFLIHRVKNSPMDGLQAVANVGKRPPYNYAHGVSEVRALHFFFDIYRNVARR